MKRIARFAPSPALVISCLALLVALSGVGYAATALKAGSVGTKQLKGNAVTSAKVKNGEIKLADLGANAVDGSKIGDGTVGAADLAPGVLPPSKAILRTRAGNVNLGTAAGALTTVLTATATPAGSYVAIYRGDVVNFDATVSGFAYQRCQLEAPSSTAVAGATTYAWANDVIVNQMTLMQTITLATASDVRVRCSHDATTATEPYIENSRLLLIPVESVDVAAVTG